MKVETPSWILETDHSAYAFGINPDGYLVHRYWGARRTTSDYSPSPVSDGWASFDGPAQLLAEEYPAHGGLSYNEPCLKATFSDGVRDVVLRFVSSEERSNYVVVTLRDIDYPLRVNLHYQAHPHHDVIQRWVEIINEGENPVTLERVFSAQWNVPSGIQTYLSHLTGRWNDEFQRVREPLMAGTKVLESRRITSSHHHNPWFLLDAGQADETQGSVWFGALAWSGNWKCTAEVTNFQATRLGIGINDWDFAWILKGGETFTSPYSVAGFTMGGYGEASRLLHDFIREQVLPHRGIVHPVLYNSWEATLFNVNQENQMALADMAAQMGVELFVLDDGWFHGRNTDAAGLGDWWPDERKFPNGLRPLIDYVHSLGMEFGLWIEPEMTNPDSELYRAHPDWILQFPTRTPTLMRNQLILNLARTDVQDYLMETIDRLLTENRIAFIKWDMNRNVSEPGWVNPQGDAREVWVRYTQGVYRVWNELRSRHPEVVWQACSGGGGRADMGILHYADQVWVSDNTHAQARLKIQAGYSMAYPACTMEAWVTDADRSQLALAYRFHVSMCGSLGIGGNLSEWTKEELVEAAYWVKRYKEIRNIIQAGDLYRLAPNVIQYLHKNKKQGVLFAFKTPDDENPGEVEFSLQGLHPKVFYEIEYFDGVQQGSAWMKNPVRIQFPPSGSLLSEIKARS